MFNPKWTLKKGINELRDTFENIDLSLELFQDKNFTRLEQLKFLIDKQLIDKNLFWK